MEKKDPTEATVAPDLPGEEAPPARAHKLTLAHVKWKTTTREGWLGQYDFKWLFTPSLPFGKRRAQIVDPPFYGQCTPLRAFRPLMAALQAWTMSCPFFSQSSADSSMHLPCWPG